MERRKGCCVLPEKPKEPSETDCCGSGCTYCVFDVYKTELLKWERECDRLLRGGDPSQNQSFFSQLEFKTFKLVAVFPSAKSSNIYRFGVPGGIRLDIKPGQHLMMKGFVLEMKAKDIGMKENVETDLCREEVSKQKEETFIEGNETVYEKKYLTRPYTVINTGSGYFDILIKLYKNGKMSKYIKGLNVGDDVLWRGPFGEYCHLPSYSVEGRKDLLALCAGTGVAPVYAISKSIISDEDDETRIRLLWANHTWEELPLTKEMKELSSYWNFSCRLFLSVDLDSVPPGAKTFFEITDGKISHEVLKHEVDSFLKTDLKVLICGTTSFEEDMMAFLNKLGIECSSCHRFK